MQLVTAVNSESRTLCSDVEALKSVWTQCGSPLENLSL